MRLILPLLGFVACSLAEGATLGTVQTKTPVRSGCDSDEPVVAELPAGQAVEIRSSISGASGSCYKVMAKMEGREVSGYVPARAIQDAAAFDQARRAAKDIGGGSTAQAVAAIATEVAKKGGREHPATKAWALIEANQPEEALRLIEKDLQRYPTDPYLHAVAGMAFYRTDQIDRAILHWKEAEAIEPSASVAALLKRAEREKSADGGSERMVGTRVVLRYERGSVSAPMAQAMLQVLDEEYSRVSFQLGCRAAEKVTAVAQSRQAYMQSTQAAEWSGGMYDGRIHVPVTESRTIDPQLRKTFAHELAHACLHELGNWPSWLQEGLAQKISGDQTAPARKALLEEAIKSGKLPKLSQLGQGWGGMNAQSAAVAYSLALLAAEKLSLMYASTGLSNVLRNPGDFGRVEAEVSAALGL